MPAGQGKREEKHRRRGIGKREKAVAWKGGQRKEGAKLWGGLPPCCWPETLPVNMLCDPGGSLLLDLSGPQFPL